MARTGTPPEHPLDAELWRLSRLAYVNWGLHLRAAPALLGLLAPAQDPSLPPEKRLKAAMEETVNRAYGCYIQANEDQIAASKVLAAAGLIGLITRERGAAESEEERSSLTAYRRSDVLDVRRNIAASWHIPKIAAATFVKRYPDSAGMGKPSKEDESFEAFREALAEFLAERGINDLVPHLNSASTYSGHIERVNDVVTPGAYDTRTGVLPPGSANISATLTKHGEVEYVSQPELEASVEAWLASSVQVLMLTGDSGDGKSRLAREYASQFQEQFLPDIEAALELADITSTEDVTPEPADTLEPSPDLVPPVRKSRKRTYIAASLAAVAVAGSWIGASFTRSHAPQPPAVTDPTGNPTGTSLRLTLVAVSDRVNSGRFTFLPTPAHIGQAFMAKVDSGAFGTNATAMLSAALSVGAYATAGLQANIQATDVSGRAVSIYNVRVVFISQTTDTPVVEAAFIGAEAEASDPSAQMAFSMGAATPIAKTFDPTRGKEGYLGTTNYFESHQVPPLGPADPSTTLTMAFGNRQGMAEFDIAIDYIVDGHKYTQTVTNNGQPFRVMGHFCPMATATLRMIARDATGANHIVPPPASTARC